MLNLDADRAGCQGDRVGVYDQTSVHCLRRDELDQRLACFADARLAWIEDCGHNLHHDQPRDLARLLADFFAEAN